MHGPHERPDRRRTKGPPDSEAGDLDAQARRRRQDAKAEALAREGAREGLDVAMRHDAEAGPAGPAGPAEAMDVGVAGDAVRHARALEHTRRAAMERKYPQLPPEDVETYVKAGFKLNKKGKLINALGRFVGAGDEPWHAIEEHLPHHPTDRPPPVATTPVATPRARSRDRAQAISPTESLAQRRTRRQSPMPTKYADYDTTGYTKPHY